MLSTVHAIWTVVLLVIFLGIIAWAFSSRRRERFDGPLTIETWVKRNWVPDGNNTNAGIFERWSSSSGGRGYRFCISGWEQLYFRYYTDTGVSRSTE